MLGQVMNFNCSGASVDCEKCTDVNNKSVSELPICVWHHKIKETLLKCCKVLAVDTLVYDS